MPLVSKSVQNIILEGNIQAVYESILLIEVVGVNIPVSDSLEAHHVWAACR